jgi:hypothetical protein
MQPNVRVSDRIARNALRLGGAREHVIRRHHDGRPSSSLTVSEQLGEAIAVRTDRVRAHMIRRHETATVPHRSGIELVEKAAGVDRRSSERNGLNTGVRGRHGPEREADARRGEGRRGAARLFEREVRFAP